MRLMPSRRNVLAMAGSGLLPILTGCQTSNPPATSDDTTSPMTKDGITQTTSSEYVLQARFESESHWLHGIELPSGIVDLKTEKIAALSDLSSITKAAVKKAITNGTYATINPSKSLLDGIDDVTIVEYRGTYYSISHTFPTYTLELDKEVNPGNAPSDQTVDFESEAVQSNEIVEHAVTTVTPLGPNHPGSSYTTTRLPEALKDFLDRYDYVKYESGIGELVLSITNRSPPHTITANEASNEELYGTEILELDSFTSRGRNLIQQTLRDQRKTPLSQAKSSHSVFPTYISERFDRQVESSHVRVDGSFYGFNAVHRHWRNLPFDITMTVVDESVNSESPARVKLIAKNTSSHNAKLTMPGIPPFGVLWAYGPSGEHLLWTSKYEQSDAVKIENDTAIPEFKMEVSVPPSQSTATTYQFGRDFERLEPGDYEVPGFISAKWPTKPDDQRFETYPYTLTLTIT